MRSVIVNGLMMGLGDIVSTAHILGRDRVQRHPQTHNVCLRIAYTYISGGVQINHLKYKLNLSMWLGVWDRKTNPIAVYSHVRPSQSCSRQHTVTTCTAHVSTKLYLCYMGDICTQTLLTIEEALWTYNAAILMIGRKWLNIDLPGAPVAIQLLMTFMNRMMVHVSSRV